MSSHENENEDEDEDSRVETRAELLPEEQAAGSDDPHAQAEAILEESDERTDDPSGTRRTSTQTPGED
ncbi:MAG: hypothetical protein ACJ72L_17120 [Marmoricola sp.]